MLTIDTKRSAKIVLIAEDDKVIGRLIAEAVKYAGFQAKCITDGIDALNFILESKPDVIVLDLILPRLQGFEICSMIRKSPTVKHTPVVVISGRVSKDDKLKAFELGADDYVTKPFQIEELIARIEAAMQRPTLSLPGLYRQSRLPSF